MQAKDKATPKALKSLRAGTLLFFGLLVGFLYHFFFIPPFVPINTGGDSFLYLAPAQRMLQGEMIYKDVYEFLPSGTALVNFFMFKLFGLRPWIPNLLAVALGVGLAWVGVVISRRLMRPELALLPSAIFVAYAARAYLYDPTHHWYSELASMAAVAVLLKDRTPTRIAVAGLLCGLATTFTQNRGVAVMAGLILFLWWESWQKHESGSSLLRKELLLSASCVATFFVFNVYFIWKVGIERYIWSTVIFVWKYYPKESDSNTFRVLAVILPDCSSLYAFLRTSAHSLVLYAFIPLVFIVFFVCYVRRSKESPIDRWERPMLLAITGAFMLLSVVPAPGDVRMVTCLLPALILLCWFLDPPGWFRGIIKAALAAGCLVIAIRALIVLSPRPAGFFETQKGKFAITDPNTFQTYVWLQQHTQPNDYFFQAANSDIYFYLNLRNPTPLSVIKTNAYTTKGQVAEVISGLELHHVRYVLLDNLRVGTLNLPKWEDPSDYHLGPLEDYLLKNYKLVKVFEESGEIWERTAG
jgi:hypothetical protein